MSAMLDANVLEEIEIGLLLEGVFRHYGVDFRNYSMDSLKRRIRSLMAREHIATIDTLPFLEELIASDVNPYPEDTDIHPVEAGYDAFARAAVERLEADGFRP